MNDDTVTSPVELVNLEPEDQTGAVYDARFSTTQNSVSANAVRLNVHQNQRWKNRHRGWNYLPCGQCRSLAKGAT